MKKLCLLLLAISSLNTHALLIAHRGVHQTYQREGLTNDTCTATRIHRPTHSYLENTLESITEAFRLGADMVEIDVHPTTEPNGVDELVVFHDWALDCRTEARCGEGCVCNEQKQCETNLQSFAFLQSLDIGFGYTHDEGRSYPFRGNFLGKMPHFNEVLELLESHLDKRLLINVKGNTKRTAQAFLRIIQSYPQSLRERLYYPYKYGFESELRAAGVERQIDQKASKCLQEYLKTGWRGHFPKICHNRRIFIPIRETLERMIGRAGRHIRFTSVLWGWPHKFIALARIHGTEIYVSQVDSLEEYREMKKLNLDGIMTNRIEVIGHNAL